MLYFFYKKYKFIKLSSSKQKYKWRKKYLF